MGLSRRGRRTPADVGTRKKEEAHELRRRHLGARALSHAADHDRNHHHHVVSDAEPIALDENRFILYVPTDFKREIVASRYIGDIKKALYDLFSAELEVVVLSEEEKEKYGKREPVSRFLPGTEEYTFERFVVAPPTNLPMPAAGGGDNSGS